MQNTISFIIKGSPQSKANSRRLVANSRTGRPMFIRSKAALAYSEAFQYQCPKLPVLMEGDLSATIRIFYDSLRPDLDESIILDSMQSRIYSNDRQIKEKHIYHGLDRNNPRAEITISTLGQAPSP